MGGIPTHNKHMERVLGLWSWIVQYYPKISEMAAEAAVLFTINKTVDWLAIVSAARKMCGIFANSKSYVIRRSW